MNESEYLVNEQIKNSQLRVINQNGTQIGIISKDEALRLAKSQNLDLIQLPTKSDIPVCRIMDFGKFKYDLQKKEKEQRRKNRENEIQTKEIRLRPVTDDNDLKIKAKKTLEFLNDGHRVKINMKFRPRELPFKSEGIRIMEVFISLLGDVRLEQNVAMNGLFLTATVFPKK